jgi:hypothetical protein
MNMHFFLSSGSSIHENIFWESWHHP